MTLPLVQHLSILGHALVTIAVHGLPQEAADIHVARVRVDTLRGAFEDGARMLHDHVMEISPSQTSAQTGSGWRT